MKKIGLSEAILESIETDKFWMSERCISAGVLYRGRTNAAKCVQSIRWLVIRKWTLLIGAKWLTLSVDEFWLKFCIKKEKKKKQTKNKSKMKWMNLSENFLKENVR